MITDYVFILYFTWLQRVQGRPGVWKQTVDGLDNFTGRPICNPIQLLYIKYNNGKVRNNKYTDVIVMREIQIEFDKLIA